MTLHNATPQAIRHAVRSLVGFAPSTDKQHRYLGALLNECFGGDDAYDPNKDRRSVIRYLAGVGSMKDLTRGQASWLIDFLRDPETGDLDVDAEQAVHRILHEAIREAGQMTFDEWERPQP